MAIHALLLYLPQGYKLATGDVHPSQLRQAREVYGDDEGKVYGALISREAGSTWAESGRSEIGQRSRRKRKRRGMGMMIYVNFDS